MAECDSLRLTVQACHIAEELTSLASKTRPLSLQLENVVQLYSWLSYRTVQEPLGCEHQTYTRNPLRVHAYHNFFCSAFSICTQHYLYMTQAKHRNTDDACFRMKEHMCGTCRVINIHVNNFPCIKPILEYIQWLDNWCTNRSRSRSNPYGLCLYLWTLQVWFCSLLTL